MINDVVAGKVFHDAYSGNSKLYLRMRDGYTVACAWDSAGPVLVDAIQLHAPTDQALEPRFQYCSGKVIRHVVTDGERLLIVFTDGHELQVNHMSSDPDPDAVHVRIALPAPPPLFGTAGGL